ncbi:MAG: hypothetical protein R3A80_02730 [Bdellovibrionota bacterium]
MSYSCIIALNSRKDSIESFFPLKKVFDEVFIVSPDSDMKLRLPANFKRLTSNKSNRAHQFNLGAHEAQSEYICFLSPDADIDTENFARLRLLLKPKTLFYFNFKFKKPCSSFYALNESLINFRSDTLGLPFINQSFSLDKKSFFETGAFSEGVIQNEDAEFIRRWKANGNPVKKAKGDISAPPSNLNASWLENSYKDSLWSLKFAIGKEPRELKLK